MTTIAIVEDNADNRLLLQAILDGLYDLVEYENGTDALAGLAASLPDLVLLDISLPGMDGNEILARIRADERLRGLHVVALTAHAMAGDRERCLQAGMDGYVSKPVEPEELFAAIEQIGNDRRPQDAAEPLEPVRVVLDREAMLRRVGADADLLLEMVQAFNGESASLLDRIRRSISSGDAVQLQRAAHSLKGALRTLAAPAASEAALQLELLARDGDLSLVDERCRVLEREMSVLQRMLSDLVVGGD